MIAFLLSPTYFLTRISVLTFTGWLMMEALLLILGNMDETHMVYNILILYLHVIYLIKRNVLGKQR